MAAPNAGASGSAARRQPDRTGPPRPAAADDYDIDAPGANDDGSGTVLTMELARVFAESGIEFDATLVFICWAGEEQGLVGARGARAARRRREGARRGRLQQRHRRQLARRQRRRRRRERARLRGRARGLAVARARALHRRRAARVRAVAPGPADGARTIASAAAATIRRSTSTATPASSSARRTRTSTGSTRPRDTLDGVDFAYLAQNARVNAAAVASLALAPPAPVVIDRARTPRARPAIRPATTRTCAGTASPGAVGYRIYWREAWTPDWQHARTVGNVTEVRAAQRVDRRLRVRRRGDRSRRPREPGQRLRVAGAAGTAHRAGEVAGWRAAAGLQRAAGWADSLSRRHPCWL